MFRGGMMKNFAMTGVAGYIAPRHLRAIRDTGNQLIAAVDPSDSVGQLDQFSFGVRFFTEFERFDRHVEKLRRGDEAGRVHYVSICSPNYLHDAHCRMALRVGAHAICEKPLVINPWNLEMLQELESETGGRVNTVLQLRLHEKLIKLRQRLRSGGADRPYEVVLTYITGRGRWYDVSWKGSVEKSGGIAMNIGVHFFDLLLWLFGRAVSSRVHLSEARRMAGFLELERARVRWFLSVDGSDLPFEVHPGQKTTFRSMTIDGEEIDFTEGFTDLHTRIYEEVLAGRGFGLDDVKPVTSLVHSIRQSPISRESELFHPLLKSADNAT